MKIISKKFLLIIWVVCAVAIATSCGVSDEGSDSIIDNKIVGVWYNVTPYNTIRGPAYSINGIKINSNGEVESLAIETNSGMLSYSDYYGKILNAHNGKISFTWNSSTSMFQGVVSSTYKVKGNKIYFNLDSNPGVIPFANEYKKTSLGAVLTDPVKSEFTIVMFDSLSNTKQQLQNLPVSPVPSAYAQLINDELIINSNFGNAYRIKIAINDYKGVGKFTNDSATFELARLIGVDQVAIVSSRFERSVIDISISEFTGKYLGGTLKVNLGSVEFEEGIFSIPVY